AVRHHDRLRLDPVGLAVLRIQYRNCFRVPRFALVLEASGGRAEPGPHRLPRLVQLWKNDSSAVNFLDSGPAGKGVRIQGFRHLAANAVVTSRKSERVLTRAAIHRSPGDPAICRNDIWTQPPAVSRTRSIEGTNGFPAQPESHHVLLHGHPVQLRGLRADCGERLPVFQDLDAHRRCEGGSFQFLIPRIDEPHAGFLSEFGSEVNAIGLLNELERTAEWNPRRGALPTLVLKLRDVETDRIVELRHE